MDIRPLFVMLLKAIDGLMLETGWKVTWFTVYRDPRTISLLIVDEKMKRLNRLAKIRELIEQAYQLLQESEHDY